MRSSSKTSREPGKANLSPAPRRWASWQITQVSVRTPAGGSWALLCLTTRASALAITPSSSAQVVTGKTTCALVAVSERKKSNWAWNSRAS
ncbi:hypothetical protein A8W25_12230 [Streptomyces sp. ERV7]|nr:hypothetical protein A8W25_12230 [Streptomyces sp. ERV7]